MIFVDTSFWIAMHNRGDRNHDVAVALWQVYESPRLTTNHVLGETWTFVRRRVGHRAARELVDTIATRTATVAVRHVTEDLERDAGDGWRATTNASTHSATRRASRSCVGCESPRHWLSTAISRRPGSSSCDPRPG